MYKTTILQIPIYDTPESDVFNLAEINQAHIKLEEFANEFKTNPDILIMEEIVNARGGKLNLDERLDEIELHKTDTNNPHSVTKEQISLGNVDNTSDENKPLSLAQRNAIADITTQLTVTDNANIYTLDLSLKKSFTIDITNTSAKTITFNNIPSDLDFAKPITVKVICSVGNTISTYPSGVIWADGITPAFVIGKTYYLTFIRTSTGWHSTYLGAF